MHIRSRVSRADLLRAVSACCKDGTCTLPLDDDVELSEIAEILEASGADH